MGVIAQFFAAGGAEAAVWDLGICEYGEVADPKQASGGIATASIATGCVYAKHESRKSRRARKGIKD